MGIVFKTTAAENYIKTPTCHPKISQRQAVKRLTLRNIKFLKSLGLKLKINEENRKRKRSYAN